MIDLFDTASGANVGTISDAELQFLMDQLEEESQEDHDYWVDLATIDLLADEGKATDHLLATLRAALGSAEGVDIRWRRR